MEPVSVAIVGMGTVGTGVARVLLEQPERLERRSGRAVRLKRAVVRDAGRALTARLSAPQRRKEQSEMAFLKLSGAFAGDALIEILPGPAKGLPELLSLGAEPFAPRTRNLRD